jgi:hypothetical protein
VTDGHVERVTAQVFISPTTPLAPFSRARMPYARSFEEHLGSDHGWAKDNAGYWQRDYARFLEFFFSQVYPEPHSTKQIEDAIGWGSETTPTTLIDTRRGAILDAGTDIGPLLGQVRSPCLVIQGTADAIVGPGAGPLLGRALGDRARLVQLAGSGHCPHARDPVQVNLLIRDFVDGLQQHRPTAPRRWTRGRSRPKRALYLSSPIGLDTPAGTRPSPTRCAGSIPTCKSTGWPSIPSPPSCRQDTNTFTPHRPSWPASLVTSRASQPGTTCTASRRGGAWTRSCWPTSWSSTT